MHATVSQIELIHASGLLDPGVFLRAAGSDRDKGDADPPEQTYLRDRTAWSVPASALFDGGYYLARNPDVRKAGVHPMLHFIRHGFFEGRNPSPLVDMDHLLRQLLPDGRLLPIGERKALRKRVFGEFAGLRELLERSGCDPSPFFSKAFYRAANPALDVDGIPLCDYYRRRGRGPDGGYLECTPLASMAFYMARHPDLEQAGVIPLRHLLLWGLQESRKFSKAETVRQSFLDNTAELFGDKRVRTLPGLLNVDDGEPHLAGPFWPTPYAERRLPSLTHTAAPDARAAFVGVVLYLNTDREVIRLQRSLEREIAGSHGYDIRYRYMANDGDLERYRTLLGDRVVASPDGDNIGFGRAHNLLMQECFEENRLYIGANPDGYFVPGCIKALVDFNDYHTGEALIEAPSLPIDHPKWHDPITLDTQWVSGACFALPQPLWEKVHGFDERIHLYCEDVDLSWRVRLQGGRLKVCPTARFMHDVTPRFGRQEDPSVAAERQRSMLQGAYYLATKWGAREKAELYRNKLARLCGRDTIATLEPDVRLDGDVVEQIACFRHERFAPSRFW